MMKPGMRLTPWMAAAIALSAPVAAHAQGGETYAQQLVDRTVAGYGDVSNVELSVLGPDSSCATLAATERKRDVGESCDEDEWDPIHTGRPDVEAPRPDDPVYDITLALHDASGRLIGAVGLDIAPSTSGGESAAVARAEEILHVLEGQIPSKAKLYERGGG